jgi:hypothetical protein
MTTLTNMNRIYAPASTNSHTSQDNFDKGKAFEEYVIHLFNEHSFRLKIHRAAVKFTDTYFPADLFNPDLEMELVFTGPKKYRFAVECKWRKKFKNGRIEWAKDVQIVSYRKFQDQVRIPVFVAIGIGGRPASPDKLFVTPLNNIWMHNEVYESDLIHFKRKPTHKFYYDIRQLRLF